MSCRFLSARCGGDHHGEDGVGEEGEDHGDRDPGDEGGGELADILPAPAAPHRGCGGREPHVGHARTHARTHAHAYTEPVFLDANMYVVNGTSNYASSPVRHVLTNYCEIKSCNRLFSKKKCNNNNNNGRNGSSYHDLLLPRSRHRFFGSCTLAVRIRVQTRIVQNLWFPIIIFLFCIYFSE